MQPTKRWFLPLLFIGVILNATGLFMDILETDGTLYADVAKHMVTHNDWMNLFAYGAEWLDKPHFPFWVTALSFKILGISSFAYKFPGFVFWVMGLRYVYLLAFKLYNESIARLAVLVYAIALQAVIGNFDVRAEAFLTALITGGIYYMYQLMYNYRWYYLLLAALFCACAVMTKGVFALVTVAAGFVILWVIEKDWKQFIKPKWWLLLVLTLVFTLPEIISLYRQFDMHPEKVVFGTTNVSGVKFFFWDSQFGRFFNSGPIKGTGDPSFFLHTTLWAFLPWSILLVMAVFVAINQKRRQRNHRLWVVYGSALVTFLMFSLSKFQLPYYITILFPHFSIMVAAYVVSVQSVASKRAVYVVQVVVLVILVALVTLLSIYAQLPHLVWIIAFTIIIALAGLLIRPGGHINKTLVVSYTFAVILYVFMNGVFYPTILQYQSAVQAAKLVNDKYQDYNVGMIVNNSAFEFYSEAPVLRVFNADSVKVSTNKLLVIYTDNSGLDTLQQRNIPFTPVQVFDDFHISMLTGDFLNAKTRNQATHKMFLVRVEER